MKAFLCTAIAAVLAAGAFALQTQQKPVEATAKAIATDAEVIAQQLPSYPLTTCLVSGEPLDAMGGPIDLVHDGRLARVCCKGCIKGVKKDPAKHFAKIDAAVIEAQKASYPLETCAISAEPLGSMGEPIDIVHGTRLVRLCCKGCVKGFKKNPAKTMAKIDAALIEAQKKDYPAETCVVSGEALGSMGDPIDMLYGTRLVRLCCKGCVKGFQKDPKAFLAKLDEKKG